MYSIVCELVVVQLHDDVRQYGAPVLPVIHNLSALNLWEIRLWVQFFTPKTLKLLFTFSYKSVVTDQS